MKNKLEDEQTTYRKYQNALMTAGQATLLFCIWNGIKIISYLTVDNSYLKEIFNPIVDEGQEMWIIVILSVIVMIIILSIDIFIHFHIGMGAVRVAKGGTWKKMDPFIIVAYIILSVYGIYAYKVLENSTRVLADVSALILEVLSDINFIVILVTSFWLFKYRNKHNDERSQVE